MKNLKKITVSMFRVVLVIDLYPAFLGNKLTNVGHFFCRIISYILCVIYIIIGYFFICGIEYW